MARLWWEQAGNEFLSYSELEFLIVQIKQTEVERKLFVKHFIWKAVLFSLSSTFQLVVCTLKTSQLICICQSGGPFTVLGCTFELRGSKLKSSASTVTWTGTGPGIPTLTLHSRTACAPTLQAWKQWQSPFTSSQIGRKSEDRPTGPVTPSTVTLGGEKVRQMTKGLVGHGNMSNQGKLLTLEILTALLFCEMPYPQALRLPIVSGFWCKFSSHSTQTHSLGLFPWDSKLVTIAWDEPGFRHRPCPDLSSLLATG